MTTTVVRQSSTARPLDPSESLALEVLKQKCHRTIEDDGRISIGYDMTQEILNPPKFVVGFSIDGELHFVSLRRQWPNHRWHARGSGLARDVGVGLQID